MRNRERGRVRWQMKRSGKVKLTFKLRNSNRNDMTGEEPGADVASYIVGVVLQLAGSSHKEMRPKPSKT